MQSILVGPGMKSTEEKFNFVMEYWKSLTSIVFKNRHDMKNGMICELEIRPTYIDDAYIQKLKEIAKCGVDIILPNYNKPKLFDGIQNELPSIDPLPYIDPIRATVEFISDELSDEQFMKIYDITKILQDPAKYVNYQS